MKNQEEVLTGWKYELIARFLLLQGKSGNLLLKILRWASAPITVVLDFWLKLIIFPNPPTVPFLLSFFPVAVSASFGGFYPGLLSIVLSAVVANLLFFPPFWANSGNFAVRANIIFALSSGTLVLLCAGFRNALIQGAKINLELQRKSEMLRLSHDAIVVWRLGGTIEFWNNGAEQLYGYIADEALGNYPQQLLRTMSAERRADIESKLRNNGEWEGELTHQDKNGKIITVSSKMQLIKDNGGYRVLETNRDITSRKKMEQQLRETREKVEQSDVKKTEFISLLSHELRNPLAPIRNSLYILNRVDPGSERSKHALAVIDRQVEQLTRLTDDLLDVTRISRGKIRLKTETLELNEVVANTAEDYRSQFIHAAVELEFLRWHPIKICADPARIKQIIGNLCRTP